MTAQSEEGYVSLANPGSVSCERTYTRGLAFRYLPYEVGLHLRKTKFAQICKCELLGAVLLYIHNVRSVCPLSFCVWYFKNAA